MFSYFPYFSSLSKSFLTFSYFFQPNNWIVPTDLCKFGITFLMFPYFPRFSLMLLIFPYFPNQTGCLDPALNGIWDNFPYFSLLSQCFHAFPYFSLFFLTFPHFALLFLTPHAVWSTRFACVGDKFQYFSKIFLIFPFFPTFPQTTCCLDYALCLHCVITFLTFPCFLNFSLLFLLFHNCSPQTGCLNLVFLLCIWNNFPHFSLLS